MLDKLFGSKNAINMAKESIDSMFFTQEEKANRFERLLTLYEPFKLAQRLLACIFGIPYAVAWFITFCASFVTDVSAQQELLNGDISRIVGLIVGFYFCGGVVDSIAGSRTKKSPN